MWLLIIVAPCKVCIASGDVALLAPALVNKDIHKLNMTQEMIHFMYMQTGHNHTL